VYDGLILRSRKALAKHLALTRGVNFHTVLGQLIQHNDNVKVALANCPATALGNNDQVLDTVSQHKKPKPTSNPISFRGIPYPTRRALARYLASIVHRAEHTVEERLMKLGDDGEAVISYFRQSKMRPPEKILEYEGQRFNRMQLGRRLAPELGRTVRAVESQLAAMNDDVIAVRAHFDQANIVVDGKIYRNRTHFVRDVSRRFHIPERKVTTWSKKKLPLDEIIEHARAWRRVRKPISQPEEISLFGWRFRSMNALYSYYTGSELGTHVRQKWREHLAAGRPLCIFPLLAERIAEHWQFGDLSEWNRFSPEREAWMPKSCLPLNTEPEEITDQMERSMVDALQPPDAMTLRRGARRAFARFIAQAGAQ
jgi:hypothetical protein